MQSQPLSKRSNKLLANLYHFLQLAGFIAGSALGFLLSDPAITALGLSGTSMALVVLALLMSTLALLFALGIRKLAPLQCEKCGHWSARHIKANAEHCYQCTACQIRWRTGIGSSPSIHTPGQ